jgi:uncharacterized repeat protein (TIGR01451 family)
MGKEQNQPVLLHSVRGKHILILLVSALIPFFTLAQALQVVNLPDYSVCAGESVILLPELSGGTPPYTYAWSPAVSLSCADCAGPIAAPVETTTYSLTVTDADHAEAVATTIVQVFPTEMTTINGFMCEWEPYEFFGQLLTVPGAYSVTFQTTEGCDSIVTLILYIWPPNIAPSKATTACIGADVTLSIMHTPDSLSNCSSQWYKATSENGPWTLIAGAIQSTYEPPTDEVDTWYYRATYSCEGAPCDADTLYPVRVSVMDVVAPPVITLTPVHPRCHSIRGNIIVSVSQSDSSYPYTMSWSDGATHTNPDGSAQFTRFGLWPGSYCVTLTNGIGCPAATACVTLESPPPIMIEADVVPNACASTSNGSISADVSGGTPPYNFAWNTGNNAAGIAGLGPGNYRLTVTDANSCTQTQAFTLESALTADAGPERDIDCSPAIAVLEGSASLSGPDIIYAWYAPDGTLISEQASVDVAQIGMYRFRVINNAVSADCYSEDEVQVGDLRDSILHEISVTLTACNTYQLRAEAVSGYAGPLELVWTRPDGSMSAGMQISATQSGVYSLRAAIPGSTCETYLARFIDAEAEQCAVIAGRVAVDEDDDCMVNAAEQGLAGWIVRASGAAQTFHSITGPDGSYQFSLPTGNYALSAILPATSWSLCTDIYDVVLNTDGQTVTVDIPVQPVAACPELSVQLSVPFLRRCFDNNYVIRVCNTGTVTVDEPQVRLKLDPFLFYESAELAPNSIQAQDIFWTLSPLAPGECRQFWVKVLVSCNVVLGQTHCSEVIAAPDNLCRPASDEWSGASLELTSECTGDEVVFRLRNAGTGDLFGPVAYTVVEDQTIISPPQSFVASLAAGAERIFAFPSNGSTYFLYAEQAPHHPFGGIVSAVVEGCGTDDAGMFSTGLANQLPQYNTTPATFTLCMPNVGAYDPNDKQAIPVGYGTQHFIHAGDPLSYKIRFQNTGTDTAFTVIIRDTLSPWLDIATLRPGPASHEYRIDIAGERTLQFTFDNILLPDSTTNLEASQGFVDFFIHTADSIPLGTRIENSAGIYFDFNEPVITNTVFHTIGADFFERVSGTFYPSAAAPQWRVFPNPASDEAMLVLEQAVAGVKTAWLYDAFGRQVLRLPFEGDRCLLQLAGMAPGWYALRVTDAAGRSLGTGRVVLR